MTLTVTQTSAAPVTRVQTFVLWFTFTTYLAGALCPLFADRLPSLLIVLLHVVPPAIFALVHGSLLYRLKGMAVFVALCLGVSTAYESLGLRTGFPFGHYYFTAVMGPKLFGLPVQLVLAYLGISYLAWVLSLLILGYRNLPLVGVRVIALPVLASLLMLAWDLSMDAAWSTLDKAWIWQSGGAYFGVPISNFFGWYLNAFTFYLLFALRCRNSSSSPQPSSKSYWRIAILFYAACAAGNILLLGTPGLPLLVTDATGKTWMTHDILATSILVSLLLMIPMALLGWLRLQEAD